MATKERRARQFFSDSAALRSVLQHHAVEADFLRYPESFNSEIDKRVIKKHAGLVTDLHGLAPNMCFTQKALEHALTDIGRQQKFFRRPGDLEEWAQTLSLRIRVFCRHFQQAWLKARGSSSTWIGMILGHKVKEPLSH